jgi:major type 1 subunit fimbrin (pilin)
MKIVNMALCLTTAGLMLSANAFASDTAGSLNTTGEVVAGTCSIAQSVLTQTVDLGNIALTDITKVSSGSQVSGTDKPFEFALTNCPITVTKVGIKFNYTADSAGNYLENTDSNPATGVRLGITTTADSTPVATGTVIQSDPFTAAAGASATVHAKVAAYRTSTQAPTEGGITSLSQVVVSYN